MHRAVWLGLLLLWCSVSFALPHGLYVGGGLLRCQTGEDDATSGVYIENLLASASSVQPNFWNVGNGYFGSRGWGGEIECGLMRRYESAYLGFRYQATGWNGHYPRSYEEHRFYSDRFVLGARLHPPLPDPFLSPLAGAALTYGWGQRSDLQRDGGFPSDVITESTERQSSKGSLGWLLECGVLVRPRCPLAFTLLFQLENLNIKLPRGDRLSELRNVEFAAVQLGTYYRF